MSLRVQQLAPLPTNRMRALAVVIVAMVAALSVVPSPSAADDDGPVDERYLDYHLTNDALLSQNRDSASVADQQLASASGALDTLSFNAAELQSRIEALDIEIDAAQVEYDLQFEAQADAIRASAVARNEVEVARVELEAWRELAKQRAIAAYITPVSTPRFLPYLQSNSMTELQRKIVILSAIAEGDAELLDGLEATGERLDERVNDLDYREAKADEGRQQMTDALEELDIKRVEQQGLQRQLDEQIAAQIAEIEALEAAKAELQRIIATREARFLAEAQQRVQWREQCSLGVIPVNAGGAPVNCSALDDPIPPSSMNWPTSGVVSSEFGFRWGRMHEGIDVAAPMNAALWAAEDGIVFFAGWLGGYGNATIIDHGGGVMSLYGHQAAIYVTEGQNVVRGEAIGAIGSTGHSTGPHLHFETLVNGAPVDPRRFLG